MYDLAVIGAGWAGINAAIAARQLGLKACLIEKDKLGGTCLNYGCIPTKALIQSAKVYTQARKSSSFGIESENLRFNFPKIQERKDKIISQLSGGMQFMLKGIDLIQAEARIISPQEVDAGGKAVKTKNIVLCCGSRPVELSGFKFDGKKIISSDDALNLKEPPLSILIVGGGVIGCEFANIFCAFGSQVTIAEKMPQLLPGEDADLAKKLESSLKKKGVKVHLNSDANSFKPDDFSLVLVCVGRKPKEKIIVDEYLRSDKPGVWAAGDCTAGIMLAHFAAYQGRIVARNIAHPQEMVSARAASVPSCIFCDPEVASCGLKEEEAKINFDIEVKKFDFAGSGMARILDNTEGFIKIITDKSSGRILGGSIIGPCATELISVINLAVTNALKIEDVRKTIFAHPTISESIAEALT